MLRARTRTARARRRPAGGGDNAAGALGGPKYFSKVIGKALDTLDAVRSAPEPLSLHELTTEVGIAKSSLFRILHTLETANYIERDGQGRYRLTERLRSSAPGQAHQLVRVAVPHMRELSRGCRETVSLAMRIDSHIEVVATIESPELIRMGNTVGRILPPHASSLGKAITAFQPEDVRETLIRSYGLHRFTEHTVVDEVELRRELEAIRTSGFSTDVEESALEGCCFGAPIRGVGGLVFSAVSLSLPKMRLRDDPHRQRLIELVVGAADRISADLRQPAGSLRQSRSAPTPA